MSQEEPTTTSQTAQEYYEELSREYLLAQLLHHKVWLTWVLMGAIILIWIAASLYGMLHLVGGEQLKNVMLNNEQLTFYTGMKLNGHIQNQGQWWRLLSSTFVHMDIMHLAFNAYGLYVLGPLIEKFYGRIRMIVIYFGTGLLASFASFVFSDIPSGGASGAIYGLVGAMLVFGYKYRDDLPTRVSRALTSGMLPWVVVGIGIGFIGVLRMDNAAHIGGLLSGAIFAVFMRARLNTSRYLRWTDHALRVTAGGLAGLVLLTFLAWGQEVSNCTATAEAYKACYPEVAQEVTDPEAVLRKLKEERKKKKK